MISHFSGEDLERYVDGRLPEAHSAAVQAHLVECEECQLRLAEIALETQWKGTERRGDPRIPVSFPARLKLLDPVTSVGPPHNVHVIEISRNGLKIRTPRFLIPKTLVQIRFNSKTVLGEVRYCDKLETEYHAGVQQVKDFPG